MSALSSNCPCYRAPVRMSMGADTRVRPYDLRHSCSYVPGPQLGRKGSLSRTGSIHLFVLSIDADSSGSPSKDSSLLTLKRASRVRPRPLHIPDRHL